MPVQMLERDRAGVKRDYVSEVGSRRAGDGTRRMFLLRQSPPRERFFITPDIRLPTSDPRLRSVGHWECFSALHELESLIEIDNPGV
jgi:hypothetical protein